MYLDCIKQDPQEARDFRSICRSNLFQNPTAGHCMDFVQTNVVFLPKSYSKDFLIFCQRNPKPCPLLEVIEGREAQITAPGSNLYSDLPKYNILEHGIITKSLLNVEEYENRGLDVFLLGCSFSFEQALIKNQVPVRHIEEGKNVPMYITNIPCRPAGVFQTNLVVSMRPIPKDLVRSAVKITSAYPAVHGSPVHVGDPLSIGIQNLNRVDYGEAVRVGEDEVPVFWACGVTPMNAILNSGIEFAITHSPGHMFITDRRNEDLNIENLSFDY